MSITPRKPPPIQVVSAIAYTPREACRAFVPPLNIRDLHTAIRLGRLKAHYVGVRHYIAADELLAWIKGRKPRTAWRRKRPATEPASAADARPQDSTKPATETTEG